MRIVGGKYRGRAIASPKTDTIRPTSDRTRESLFNILNHAYSDHLDGARMLELFAGTGAVGIEALSRGAEFVLFVEKGIEGRGLLRQNIDDFSLHGCTKVFKRDATKLGPRAKFEPFNLLFADPPYKKSMGERAILSAADGDWLADDTLVILEEHKDVEPKLDERFTSLEQRPFGLTNIWLYSFLK